MKSDNNLYRFLRIETSFVIHRFQERGLLNTVLDYLRKPSRSVGQKAHPRIFYTMGAKEDPPDPFDDIQEMHQEIQLELFFWKCNRSEIALC